MYVTAALEGGQHMKHKLYPTTAALAHQIAALGQATPADPRSAGGWSTAPSRRGVSAGIC
jgi:hypothetical protein